jgi:hypothetical protein
MLFGKGTDTSAHGLDVYARTFALRQSAPNPFNPSTRIEYALTRAGTVTLGVYDVAGRLVRVLVDSRPVPEGAHRAIWDGRDGLGRSVASGTYFYRLEVDGDVLTRKMVFLK